MKTSNFIALTALIVTVVFGVKGDFGDYIFISVILMYCTSFIVRELEKINEKL